MRRFLLIVTLLWAVVLPAVSSAAAYSWHYPLEIQAGLSSNFGEFRGQRVHTGIDLRTNGGNGYKVYAIDDGAIVRLSVKKRGFGNAVYIQHKNGVMSVYAHLERFTDKSLGLQTLVRTYQKRRNSKYPGNIFLKTPISVKRGQLIAYSGESGAGLPHLHFEVRKGADTPIDPFDFGFSYQDTTPPVVSSIILDPLGPHSFIDGTHMAREYQVLDTQGRLSVSQQPRVSGYVRFTVAAYDRIGAKNRCGVDRLVMSIDGEPFFRNHFTQVTYNANHRGGLVYDFTLTRLSNPSQYYYRLYNLAPAYFPYHQVFAQNQGVWDTSRVAEGLHEITIEITDVMGNSSRTSMQVSVDHAPRNLIHLPQGATPWTVELLDFQDFVEIVCRLEEPLSAEPVVDITSNRHSAPVRLSLSPAGPQTFAGTYQLTPKDKGTLRFLVQATTERGQRLKESRSFQVSPISSKSGGTVAYGAQASMTFPPGALYEDVFANIFPTTAYEVTPGLPLVSQVFDFRPAGEPLEKKGTIRIQYPATVTDRKKLGIFWWDRIKKRWYFMDDTHDPANQSLSAKIIYPSIYGMLEDTVSPVIASISPEDGKTVAPSRATVSAVITDRGKGVDESSIIIRLDGNHLAGEYDPDRSKVTCELSRALPRGKHTLTVQAADRAGNVATMARSTFFVK